MVCVGQGAAALTGNRRRAFMYSAPERTEMKVFSASFTLVGEEQTEILDITKHVREAIQRSPISNGIALINTLHTTCALFINEFQSALMDDLRNLAERLVPERGGFRHLSLIHISEPTRLL